MSVFEAASEARRASTGRTEREEVEAEDEDALWSLVVGVAASVSHEATRRGPREGCAALSGVWPMQLRTPSGWKTLGRGRNERNCERR
jgi:hypothetical protein